MKKLTLENLKKAFIEKGWTLREEGPSRPLIATKEGRDTVCLYDMMRWGKNDVRDFFSRETTDRGKRNNITSKEENKPVPRAEWLEKQLEETKELPHKVGRGDADSVLERKYDELALKEAHSNAVEELGQKDIPSKSAPDFLQAGIEAMKDRAASRDNESERSMAKTVKAFNTLTGRKLSEREGWLFMVCLKLARANNGKKTVEDDFIDGAAYMALYGECAVNRFEECEATFVEPKAFADELAELEEKLKSERSEFVPSVGAEPKPPCPPKGYPRAGSRVRFRDNAREFWGTVYYPPSGECKVRPDNKPEVSLSFKQLNALEVAPPPGD